MQRIIIVVSSKLSTTIDQNVLGGLTIGSLFPNLSLLQARSEGVPSIPF
jgi:hypothetical protein